MCVCACVVQALGGGGQVIVTVWTDLTHVFIWYPACHHPDITCDQSFPSYVHTASCVLQLNLRFLHGCSRAEQVLLRWTRGVYKEGRAGWRLWKVS